MKKIKIKDLSWWNRIIIKLIGLTIKRPKYEQASKKAKEIQRRKIRT
jgi:hypothetical protein